MSKHHTGSKLKAEIVSVVIDGKSKWTLTGDHPQNLLPEPVNHHVQLHY